MELAGKKCTKACKKCDRVLPREEFHRNNARPDGLQTQCKACRRIIDDKRRVSGYWRAKDLKSNYGMSPQQYEALHQAQGGKCLICKTSNPGGQGGKLHVDHSHETGKVRGLLCTNCNRGLGFFQDQIENLTAAINYLTHAETQTQHLLQQYRAEA
jgi:hypothetical protein